MGQSSTSPKTAISMRRIRALALGVTLAAVVAPPKRRQDRSLEAPSSPGEGRAAALMTQEERSPGQGVVVDHSRKVLLVLHKDKRAGGGHKVHLRPVRGEELLLAAQVVKGEEWPDACGQARATEVLRVQRSGAPGEAAVGLHGNVTGAGGSTRHLEAVYSQKRRTPTHK